MYETPRVGHAWRSEKDLAFEWLERARLQDPGMCYLNYDPFIRTLRSDPRYAELLGKMMLPVD